MDGSTTSLENAASTASGAAPQDTSNVPQPPRQDAGKSTGAKVSARGDVEAAFKEIEAKGVQKADAAQTGPQGEPGSQPARGPDGKFAKAEPESTESTEAKVEPINPPSKWKGDPKINWGRLPREVQEAFVADFKSFEDQAAQFEPINAILAPRAQALTAEFGSVPNAIHQLFNLSDYANRDPIGFLNWFARSRGISFNQPGQQQPTENRQSAPANTDPLVALHSRLNGLEQRFQTAEQAEAAAVQTRAQTDVQAMLADAKKFPYAQDVREEMAREFASGNATTLEAAYERATWANPTIRAKLVAARQTAELDRQAQVAASKQNLAVSVTGSPGGNAQPGNRKATVRDDVIAAATQIGFGGVARL